MGLFIELGAENKIGERSLLMKKIFSLCLAMLLLFGMMPLTSMAAEIEDQSANICSVDGKLAEQIAENNRLVDELWQQALAESVSPVYRMGDALAENQVMPLASMKSASTAYYHFYGLNLIGILFKATFSTTTDAYGHEIVDTVRTITATKKNDNTRVTIDDYSYTVIDKGRTIATIFSCTIGTRRTAEDSFSYISYDYYVEFYVNGAANVLNGEADVF